MAAFVYDGSVPGHTVWRVVGKVFLAGTTVEVTDEEARKLRCLPFFCEVQSAKDSNPRIVTAAVVNEPASDSSPVDATQPRKRGRPPGVKNKPKVNTDGNEDAG